MSGIRYQRDGMAIDAVPDFDHDECEVERDPDREGAAEIARRMTMRMGVSLAVPIVTMCVHGADLVA